MAHSWRGSCHGWSVSHCGIAKSRRVVSWPWATAAMPVLNTEDVTVAQFVASTFY